MTGSCQDIFVKFQILRTSKIISFIIDPKFLDISPKLHIQMNSESFKFQFSYTFWILRKPKVSVFSMFCGSITFFRIVLINVSNARRTKFSSKMYRSTLLGLIVFTNTFREQWDKFSIFYNFSKIRKQLKYIFWLDFHEISIEGTKNQAWSVSARVRNYWELKICSRFINFTTCQILRLWKET